MNISIKKLLGNHLFCIGLLYLPVFIILLISNTIPHVEAYDLYGCFNIFMYFVYILGITSLIYFFFRLKVYKKIFLKIIQTLTLLKDKKIRIRVIVDIILIICMGVFCVAVSFAEAYIKNGDSYTNGSYFNQYRFMFYYATLLIAYVFFRLRKQIMLHMERAILPILLISGIIMVFSTHSCTNVSWDDAIHYNSANSLTGLTEYSRTFVEDDLLENTAKKQYLLSDTYFIMRYNDQQHMLLDKVEQNTDDIIMDSSYVKIVQNICYMPAAIFIGIAKLLSLPFHLRFAIGKLGNLLVYSFAAYFALKKIKQGKMLLAGIYLIPMNLFIAANYSYDYWVTSLSLLGFAYLYSEMQTPDEKISSKSMAVMVGSLFLAFTPKAVYFPLMALLYCMPKKKFQNDKAYKHYIIMVTCAIMYLFLSFLIPSIISGPSTDLRGGADVNGAAQVSYILHNPIEYAKTLLQFLKQYLSINSTKEYTTFLAYYEAGSKYIAVTVLLVLYALLDRSTLNQHTGKNWYRLLSVFCAFCAIALVATALFVAFTPVGSRHIAGCQPRYIMPVIFPVLYVLGTNKTTGYFTKNWHYFICLAANSFIVLATFWTQCIGLYY